MANEKKELTKEMDETQENTTSTLISLMESASRIGNAYIELNKSIMDAIPKELIDLVVKISQTPLPVIDLPFVDEVDTEDIINSNSEQGWTLTGEMTFAEYIVDDMVGMSLEDKDAYFYNYYSQNDWERFNHMKDQILERIEPRWTDLIQECFDSFENDNYKSVIPALFTIIEGEMASVFKTHAGSGPIIKTMQKQAETIESKYKQIALYSIFYSMKDRLFGSHDFAEDRNKLINRHRVLHGRDEPDQWQKVDVLRLLTVVSSLQFVKGILKEIE